jgi:hypothetical protein
MRYLKTFGVVVLTTALWSCAAQAQGNRQGGVPSGGYAQTCQDIHTNGNTLEAKCQTMNGQWNRTSLQNFNECTGGIENVDGRLACNKNGNSGQNYRSGDQQDRRNNGQGYGSGDQQGDRDRHDNEQGNRPGDWHNGVPYGGYSQTCQDIRASGTTLLASCQKRNGQWRQSSLRNFNQCRGEIENNNGKLVCGR